MSAAATELLENVREAAKPGIWSLGVNLARGSAVTLESHDEREAVLRVKAAGRMVPHTATLHLDDGDWECDCPGRVDPCEHVAGAAIALPALLAEATRGGGVGGAPVRKVSRVLHRFERVDGGLSLRRTLWKPDGSEVPLEGGLAGALKAHGTGLQVEQSDLNVDRILEKPLRGALSAERLDALMTALTDARYVMLEGQPVVVSAEIVQPRAWVEDRGADLALTIARNPRVTEVVSAGVALCGDTLNRLGETALAGAWLQALPRVQLFPPEKLGELGTRVLPEFSRRFPVEVRSQRVPPVDRELKPRVLLELTQLDAGLSVFPTLVYGAPPHVRIDAGKMVYLRSSVPLRDEPAEQRLVARLRDELNLIPGHRSTVLGPAMARMADQLLRWQGSLAGDAAKVVGSRLRLVPLLSTTAEGAVSEEGIPRLRADLRFGVEGEGATPGASVDAEAVMRAWQEGLGLMPLQGGGWAPLPMDFLAKHGEQVAELLAARGQNGELANHALPALGALSDALEQPRPLGLAQLQPLLDGFTELPEPTLPADLQATLRPYQRQGVSWLSFLRRGGLGGVLADDMGLGKTLQAICVLGPSSLVVCPTSVLPNWQQELARFRPRLKVATYHGSGRELDEAADITLTTYSILRLDAAELAARKWKTVVLDEAQAIKNPDSQVARAAYGLDAELRLALSGTPVENRLEELWSVLHFTNRGLLGGRRDFDEKWAQPIAEGRPGAAAALRKRIRPFVLRRLKQEVAPELPPRTESVLHVTLDDAERAVYDTVLAATRAEVVKLLGEGGSVLKALEALLRLRQAACHTALVPGQQGRSSSRSSSKVKTLLESLATAVDEGHRALVFSQWTGLLDLIEPELTSAGISFERLDGTTRDRGAVVARFQAPGGAPVMLLSLKAGGTGLNLTSADHVYLVDPWWNPAVEAQAADRAHRIGQENPVFVHRLVSQGTVEERILKLQDKKRALFEAALGEAAGATSLTRDDLLELFA